jgi:type IV secretory pathway VirB10-like protein
MPSLRTWQREKATLVQARRVFRTGIAISLALHAAILVWLALSPSPAPVQEPEAIVAVSLVPGQPEAAPATREQKEEPPSPPPSPDSADAPAIPGGTQASPAPSPPERAESTPPAAAGTAADDQKTDMVAAKSFFAAAILARPENREALAALKTLSPEERNEQLCDTEAMEQIRRQNPNLHPDRLVAYALKETEADGSRLRAPGAAIRSRHRWYRLSFDCTVDPVRGAVTAFRFALGTPIPSERWNDLHLER